MIGQLCACDMDNFGDILYPVMFRKMALKHGLRSPITPLGFLEGPAPSNSNYMIRSINTIVSSPARHFSRLVIGGGDLLRTDHDRLAYHYCDVVAQRLKAQLRYRLKRLLLGKKHFVQLQAKLCEEFTRKYMNYSHLGPYILNRHHYTDLKSVVYCSCGTPFSFAQEESAALKEAFDAASFIYLRDVPSRNKLLEIGVERPIHVAPDLVVALSDFFHKDVERQKGLDILKGRGVDTSKKIVCFQANPQTPENRQELLAQLTQLSKNQDLEIILLPIGVCHGDDKFLVRLAKQSGWALKYVNPHSIFETISIIAACDAFIGTSMHGNIVAFSFGIPHLFGPIPVDKAEGFLNIVGLGPEFKLDSWAHIGNKYAMLTKLPPNFVQSKALEAKRRVHSTFAMLASALETGTASHHRPL